MTAQQFHSILISLFRMSFQINKEIHYSPQRDSMLIMSMILANNKIIENTNGKKEREIQKAHIVLVFCFSQCVFHSL